MYYIELAFGHSRINGEAVPDSHIVQAEQQVLTFFAQWFGGGQRYKTFGSYQTADDQLVLESCTILRTYALEVKQYWDQLHALAREIGHFLEQACVAVIVIQVDGSLAFVEPEKLLV